MVLANMLLANTHVISAQAVCSYYNVDPQLGLDDGSCEIYEARFGLNELERQASKSVWVLLGEQFQDLLARILMAAALVSLALALVSGSSEGLTSFVEPFIIMMILVANAAVSVWQESNAEKSLEALKKLQPELARVLRNGSWLQLPARCLVPGDIVEIRVGDKVPADLRVISLNTVSLRAEQSQLTGETQTVPKEPAALDATYCDCEIQSKVNTLFASTTIANGSGRGIVVATGMSTEIGKVQSAVQAAGAEDEVTPLQQKLDEFGQMLSKVILVICILVWLINFGNFAEPSHGGFVKGCVYYFKTAVALAVAAIPEGLTAVITTCLALGTRKMAQKNAIVRRLPSVETLGCTTVICSDKTGTLTTNEMSCIRFSTVASTTELDLYEVEGHTYAPVGTVKRIASAESLLGGIPIHSRNVSSPARLRGPLPAAAAAASTEDEVCGSTNLSTVTTTVAGEFSHIGGANIGLQLLASCASVCNEAKLLISTTPPQRFTKIGEPTEAALKVLVEKLGCPHPEVNRANLQRLDRESPEAFGDVWRKKYKSLAVLEFSRDRKAMSVLCREEATGRTIQFVKGAPEAILERSHSAVLPDGAVVTLTPQLRQVILDEVKFMASQALRTLALAVRFDTGTLADYDGSPEHPEHNSLLNPENFVRFETKLTFCGLTGLLDPPRPEVALAIRQCGAAGIKVIMITGDNKMTAEAIALKIGIVPRNAVLSRISFTGREFEALPDAEKIRVLGAPHGAVFSRTEPKHKQMIVKILKELGEITAMTGDGVNDAPALKQADIGIAMGITGTEVAKEASDMVLADDNFSTIVLAVEEGRSIYNNMKAFIRYLISSNIGEVASIFMTAALGIPEGLAPVQLLWVNLVTDGFPATALGFNPPDVDVMTKTPRKRDESLISPWVLFRYLVIGLYVGFATVGIFIWWFLYGVAPEDGHTLISFWQLSHWSECHKWSSFNVNPVYGMNPADPCSFFTEGKIKASTLSLTVLVVIEMLNALNALSLDGSLFHLPPWYNPWLVLAIIGSIAVHCLILYVAPLATVFGVVPLTLEDWIWVLIWSFPVLVIDETLKAYNRLKERRAERLGISPRGIPKKLL